MSCWALRPRAGWAGIEVSRENQLPERCRSHGGCHRALCYKGRDCERGDHN